MNPFSGASWLWRAWRGGSLTFAILFALGVLGISVLGAVQHLLGRWGAPWYILLLAPFLLVGALVRREAQWIPDPEKRRSWARRILYGSIALAVLIGWLTPDRPPSPPTGSTDPSWNDIRR